MKIVAILLIVGVLVFLAIMGFQIYKTLCTNFIFEEHWPDDNTESEQTKKQQTFDLFNVQRKKEKGEKLNASFVDQL